VKTLDQLDWAALKGVSRRKIMQLSSCEYLTKAEDIVLAGPIGTGKTHIAISYRRRGSQEALSGGIREDLRVSEEPA
jgi:DNA replication protein DnaC